MMTREPGIGKRQPARRRPRRGAPRHPVRPIHSAALLAALLVGACTGPGGGADATHPAVTAALPTTAPAPVVEDAGGAVYRVVVDQGTLWSGRSDVFWSFACRASLPPQCGDDVIVFGVDLEDLPTAMSTGGITWVDGVTISGDFEPIAARLDVTEVVIPMPDPHDALPAKPAPDASTGREPPPCDPVGGWPGRPPENPGIGEDLIAYTERHPETYGGLWVAEGSVLVVQFTDPSSHVDAIAELHPGPFCLERVEHSRAEAVAKADEVFAARAALRPQGTLVLSVGAGGRDAVAIVTVFLDDPRTVATIGERFGDELVRIESVARLIDSDDRPDASAPTPRHQDSPPSSAP